jgi:DNA-binding transcriptional ArsR family regulator
MSNSLSQTDSLTREELDEMLGHAAGEIGLDERDLAVAVVVGRARGLLQQAMSTAGVGVRELARRLKVSPSAVSRHLRSEGDMRLSTAVMLADGLDRRWELGLVEKQPHAAPVRNYFTLGRGAEVQKPTVDVVAATRGAA